MQAGFAFMNCLTVIQTSQGLAKYLQRTFPSRSTERYVVVIGADARKNSGKFASLVANAFLAEGFVVHWYSTPCQTPLVAYGTRLIGADAGVMITASHVSEVYIPLVAVKPLTIAQNPAQDNGQCLLSCETTYAN